MLEARKSNSEPYTPDTLYKICAGLLWYIRERRPEINIFKDSNYANFQRTLDGEMKRLHASGLGVKKRQAEPITVEEENKLWEKGVLGESDPQTLLDTVLFFVEFISLSAVVKSIEALNCHSLSFRQMKMDLPFSFTPKTHQKITREGFLIIN